MKEVIKKDKAKRKFNPRMLYFKKESMSVFCWLKMEKKEKEKQQ